jgi:hypothetical protein
MIQKFLTSKLSGYVAIIAVIAVLGMVFYIYNEGKKSCVGDIATKQVEATHDTLKGVNDVRKKEQNLNDADLNITLCRIGIVRGNSGCE